MNYRGNKKMQLAGKFDPLRPKGLGVQAQDNTRAMPLYDQVKVDQIKTNKENKEAIEAEMILRRAGMDERNARIQANPRTRLKTSQQLLDEQGNKEFRTRMSQGYDPNKPIEEQYNLANARGLDQRLYRGSKMLMQQDLGNPVLNTAKDLMFAQGNSFVNATSPNENYIKPGVGQGATNLAMDALMIAPNMVVEGVGKALGAGRQALRGTKKGLSNIGVDDLGIYTKQGDKQLYELNNGFGDIKSTPTTDPALMARIDPIIGVPLGPPTYYNQNPMNPMMSSFFNKKGPDWDNFKSMLNNMSEKEKAALYGFDNPHTAKYQSPLTGLHARGNNKQMKFNFQQIDAVDDGWKAARKLEGDANEFVHNAINLPALSQSRHPLWKNHDDIMKERQFRQMFFPEKTGNPMVDNFNTSYPKESKQIENLLDGYNPTKYDKTSTKQLDDYIQTMADQRDAASYYYPHATAESVPPIKYRHNNARELADDAIHNSYKQEQLRTPMKTQPYDMKLFRGISPQKRGGRMQSGGQWLLDGSWSPGYVDKRTGAWVSTGDNVVSEPVSKDTPLDNIIGKSPWIRNNQPVLQYNTPANLYYSSQTPSSINDCPEGYAKDETGQCIEDNGYNPSQEKQKGMPITGATNPDGEHVGGTGAQVNEHGYQNANTKSPSTSGNSSVTQTTTKAPHNWNTDIFLGLRGTQMAATYLGQKRRNNQLNDYRYKQNTALGQMNPIPVSQFQYSNVDYTTPNRLYAQEGGMINPYSQYAKYGGNLRTIIKNYKKWTNDVEPMDMGEGHIDNQGLMKKGGLTPNEARQILHDKEVKNHPLTNKQRRFFGAKSKGHTNYKGK